MANTPGNVQGPIIDAIALAAPAATFAVATPATEVGMKTPSQLISTPITVDMSSMNPWTDCRNNRIEFASLQNRIADLKVIHGYAGTYVQAVMHSASGHYIHFTGADSDSEALMGLEYDFSFSQTENLLKVILENEMGDSAYKTAHATTTTATWAAGVNTANRMRRGIQRVLIGGEHLGALRGCSGNLKSYSTKMQGNRSLLLGTDVSTKIILGQNSATETDFAIDAANDSDSVVIDFWNGESIKYTNLLAGKPATIKYGSDENTIEIDIKARFSKGATRIDFTSVATTAEFIFLDNIAQA